VKVNVGGSLMVALVSLVGLPCCCAAQEPAAMKIPAPEIQAIDEWINSKPIALKDLRGRVVVLHFWTFG
jgi:hypothetical protein